MRKKLCGIYSITNIVNGKKIIGQSVDIRDRWNKHKAALKRNDHENFHLQRSYNKYGLESFKFEIILLCEVSVLDNEEIRLIKENHTTDRALGYNLTSGGKRYKFTGEIKQKIREATSGEKNHNFGKKLTEETKRKMSESRSGEGNPNFGKTFSKEHREKLRQSHLGEKHHQYGKPLSEEHKNRIKIANSGKNCYAFGTHLSDETKKKLSESGKIAWKKRRLNQDNPPSINL